VSWRSWNRNRDGLDLETLVSRFGQQSPARCVHFLRQACRSLEEAHAKGLVHRDIKPANLVTCSVGLDIDVLKVLDLGLARTVSRVPEARTPA
jgi:serine/threonine protein kinase